MELRWSDPTPPSLEVYTGGSGAGEVLLTWAGRPADVQRWQYRYQGLPERRKRHYIPMDSKTGELIRNTGHS